MKIFGVKEKPVNGGLAKPKLFHISFFIWPTLLQGAHLKISDAPIEIKCTTFKCLIKLNIF